MGHAGAGVGQKVQLLVIKMDAVGKPHVITQPAQGFHVGLGAHSVPLQDVDLLVLGLAQVGVQPYPQRAGQRGGLPQQLRLTLKGEQGARATIRMDRGLGSCHRSTAAWQSAKISSTVWTTLSGGRPPFFRLRSMLPREAYIRMPGASAARNWASSKDWESPPGKT